MLIDLSLKYLGDDLFTIILEGDYLFVMKYSDWSAEIKNYVDEHGTTPISIRNSKILSKNDNILSVWSGTFIML
jgi:hypothetical protein